MYENNFDNRLRDDLTKPMEARLSQMTDEEIMAILDAHKQEQMDYNAQEEENRRKRHLSVPHSLENTNIKDDRGKFSGSASYLRGDYQDVPLR